MLGWITSGFPDGCKMRVENQVRAFVEPQRHAFRLNVRNGSRLPEKQMAVGIEDLRLDADLHAAKTRAGLGFALARRILRDPPEYWRGARSACRPGRISIALTQRVS